MGRMALAVSLLLIWAAFHASVILLIFHPFSSPKMHLFSENSLAPLQHGIVTNQGGLWPPKVAAVRMCCSYNRWANSVLQEGERSEVGKSSFLCSCLFSWALYAASEVLICGESAWKCTKSGTRPFHPPCLGMKLKLKPHNDCNCLFSVLLLE